MPGRTTHRRPRTARRCSAVVGWLILVPAPAAAGGGTLVDTHGWMAAWGLGLLIGFCVGFLWQKRTLRRRTVELRRELFERQTAEKELLASEQKLRGSLAEKEALLKEIHHRVKNNLQIVSSLLYLQENELQDPRGVEVLRESQNRVKSMALIHEQLYGTADLANIDFGRYIHGLAANLVDAYGVDPARIRIDVQADDILLGVDMAVPCGLIVNELVSNAVKHAFPPGASGTIDVAVRRPTPGRMEIVVADDGVGFAMAPAEAGRTSLGLRLIDTLTAQLAGTVSVTTDQGTRFGIVVDIPEIGSKGTLT